MNSLKAITIGDINGIGLELLLNLYKNKNKNDFVLFTDIKKFNDYINKNKIKIKTNHINYCKKKSVYNKKLFNIFSYKSSSNEDNTVKSLIYAHKECLKGNYIGIITLPLRKDLIIKNIDRKFIGQTEFFQKLEKKTVSNMILFHKKIITSPLTTHISLKSVSKEVLKKDFLSNKISTINNTLKIDFNIDNPKIIVSGINPHAGENGEIGFEENKISQILSQLKKNKINVDGPVSADSMLLEKNLKYYDCFVFMYHDQALIPFKYISKFTGVNYTSNLNIIRVSPDHGTAYSLKGSKNVSSASLENCFKLIKFIYKNRNAKNKAKKIIKSKFFN